MKLLSFVYILLFSSIFVLFYLPKSTNGEVDYITKCPNVTEHYHETTKHYQTPLEELDELNRRRNLELLGIFDYEYTVPGSILLLYGLNLFTYEAFPAGLSAPYSDWMAKLKTSRGVTEQLFEMGCSNFYRTWSLPGENRQPDSPYEYIVPDHIMKAESNEYRGKTETFHYHHSFQDITTSFRGQVEFTTDLGFLGGSSLSVSYQKKVQTLIENEVKIAETRRSKKLVKLTTKSKVDLRKHLNHKFEDSWNELPETYESKSNKEKYDNFFDMFGTHYFFIADIGSTQHMRSETSKHFLQSHSESTLQECAKVKVLDKEYESKTSQKVSKEDYSEFLEQSNFTEEYSTSGGFVRQILFDLRSKIEVWETIWPIHPWVVSGQVMATYTLISNPKKRDNVQLALLVKQLETFIGKYGKKIDKLIDYYKGRMEYEGNYSTESRGYIVEIRSAEWANCADSIPKEVKEMICCDPGFSIKNVVKAYQNITSFYKSPILDQTLMDTIQSDAEIIQVGLLDAENNCFKANRDN